MKLRDKAFARRFTKISVQEPTIEQTKKILQALLNKGISFRCSKDLVIKEASDLAIKVSDLQKDLHFPDKAIKLLRKEVVKALSRKSSHVELPDILSVLRELKSVPEIILSILNEKKVEEPSTQENLENNIQENPENRIQKNQENEVRVLTCDEDINLIRRKLEESYRRFFQSLSDEDNDRSVKDMPIWRESVKIRL